MNLILKEYLSQLKESNELDKLIPDLLLAMGIKTLTRTQIGPRQYGVDLAAVGIDPQTNLKTLFLFTIKQGDITRNIWNETNVGVKDSLDEIRDVYINNNIPPLHKTLPIKIIISTGGSMEQTVEQNWVGYQKNNITSNLSYDFWGSDELAPLISSHLMSEHLLPLELRSLFRKSLALIGDSDYDCSDFYELSRKLIIEPDFGDLTKASNRKKVVKAINTLNLCANIVFYWAQSENNLKQAMKCAERAALYSWHIVRQSQLVTKPTIISAYTEIHLTLSKVQQAYFAKLRAHTQVESGLCGYSRFSVLEGLNVFEQLGFIANAGIMATELAVSLNKTHLASDYVQAVCDLIKNHKALNAPLYDEHIIEIFIAFELMLSHNKDQEVRNWLYEIVNQSIFAYDILGHHFPVCNDSYEDLISVCMTGSIDKKDLMSFSTLYAALLQLCIAKSWEEEFEYIRKRINCFGKCDLQVWYPCASTDDYLYVSNAGYESGNTVAPIEYTKPLVEMRETMKKFKASNYKTSGMKISALSDEWNALPLIASRHFRTPILPHYWEKYLS
jgi:hypothetical protein